jgi:hypothetical protein
VTRAGNADTMGAAKQGDFTIKQELVIRTVYNKIRHVL